MPVIKSSAIRERNSLRIFGCSEAEALRVNQGLPLRHPEGWALKYCMQRQAAKKRGIGWSITFPEWMALWHDSGVMNQRGKGRLCFCMARHGDEGPYRVGNVSIKSNVENSSEGLKKTHRMGRAYQPRPSTGRGWTKRSAGPRPYQVMVGKQYIGVFSSESEARSAYLAATGVHQGSPLLKP